MNDRIYLDDLNHNLRYVKMFIDEQRAALTYILSFPEHIQTDRYFDYEWFIKLRYRLASHIFSLYQIDNYTLDLTDSEHDNILRQTIEKFMDSIRIYTSQTNRIENDVIYFIYKSLVMRGDKYLEWIISDDVIYDLMQYIRRVNPQSPDEEFFSKREREKLVKKQVKYVSEEKSEENKPKKVYKRSQQTRGTKKQTSFRKQTTSKT